MSKLRFEIPGPPVPCARPRVVRQPGRGVRTIMPAKTVEYEHRCGMAAIAARPDGWPLNATYSVEAIFFRAANRGDVDNFLKAFLDGVTGVLWKNDSTVVEVRARMHVSEVPCTIVCIEVLDDE